jgi:hypothetical protein
MRSRYLLLALGAFGSMAIAQTAQPARTTTQYRKISEVRGGWVWYLNRRSVEPAGTGMVHFWLTGDNQGTGSVRRTMIEVKLACGQGLHIPLHTTNFPAAGGTPTHVLKGDSPENWTRVLLGSPVAAATPWVC